MLSAFQNSLKIPELRQRILFTLAMIVIIRIGAAITLPGVDASVLQDWIASRTNDESGGAAALGALINVFSGGGLQNCAIFSLGIMPYISASIMMQLLTAVVPRLSKLAREEGGRQKITMYTRVATLFLCIFQGGLLAKSLLAPERNIFLSGIGQVIQETGKSLVPTNNPTAFILLTITVITAGTMLLMWLGEQITERGIGNGISLIISVNIISALPGTLVQVWQTYVSGESASAINAMVLVALVAFVILVIAGVIALTQAMRRIPIQYAKRVVGRKVMGGQKNYMPLKVNFAGVMPIIFAQAILTFPAMILGQLSMGSGWTYVVISTLMIFFFSYFWVATMFQPSQIADDLKRNGGYIPGVRPGKPTSEFLDFTMGRLTFAGALFLTIIYLLPLLMSKALKVDAQTFQIFGGTSLLILVGVLLDVMRQVETHLLQRHYDGFLRKGKIRGRFDRQAAAGGKLAGKNSLLLLWVVIALLVILGACYMIYKTTSPAA